VEAGAAAAHRDGAACPDPSTRLRASVGSEALLELGDAGAEAEISGLEHLVHRLDLGSGDVG